MQLFEMKKSLYRSTNKLVYLVITFSIDWFINGAAQWLALLLLRKKVLGW